jgi:hypothetical protein
MAAKRGRPAGVRFSDEHRDKIKKSNILTALIEHAQGDREMTATQVQAGLGLLKFAFPPLQPVATEQDGESSAQTLVFRWKS